MRWLDWTATLAFAAALSTSGCGGGGSSGSGGSSGGSSASSAGSGGQASASTAGSGGNTSSSTGTAGGNADIPGGGTILFQESFEDGDFASRGWYDGSSGALSAAEHVPGSASSFECAFAMGASSCSGGKPARHKFTPSESVYLSFHIKFSDDWVGSGKPYHPHMFHFLTDLDMDYVGPSHTFLTTYTEVVNGAALLALQDSKNVDLNCILENDDTFVGCNGDFDTYSFTEARSVCSCNGIAGDLDGRDCFPNGDGTWYSSRAWRADAAFSNSPGPSYKGDFHFVEIYFQMNTIQNGIGVPDGKIRWVQDGKTLISHDAILLRTGAHPDAKFNQFAMLPYIGDGSPIAQRFWIDDFTVATARP